jgi:hypothetical protein
LVQFRIIQDSDDDQVASLTVPLAVSAPAQIPTDEQPNPDDQPHPPHEGSTFSGVSGSGAMSNTANALLSSSWEPPSTNHSPSFDHFFFEPAHQITLKVRPVTPRQFLPRVRGNCK